MNEQLDLVINDGGRSKYFSGKNVRDCVTRAIAIAAEKDYKEVYDYIFKFCGRTPRNGVLKKDAKKLMKVLGYKWVPLTFLGIGVKNHLRKNELPMDKRIICSCSGHFVAVINGKVHDTFDCRYNGNRAVYGYWIVK